MNLVAMVVRCMHDILYHVHYRRARAKVFSKKHDSYAHMYNKLAAAMPSAQQ